MLDTRYGLHDSQSKKEEPIQVVLLALPHCAASSVHGILDILTTANYCHSLNVGRGAPALFNLQVVTPDDEPVRAYNGAMIVPTVTMAGLRPDILIIASAVEAVTTPVFLDKHLLMLKDIYEWIRHLYAEGTLMASACTGNFLLAEAGLLEGKTVTTHWRAAEHFRHRYPDIHLQIDKILIDNGDVICAGGATAYIDMCFHLIERFAGQSLASACSKLHVFDIHRDQQAPYMMFTGFKSHKDERIKQAQEWMEQNYADQFSVDDIADRVGLGARTFKRRFKEATGETPISYLQQVRIEAVKNLLETTIKSFNEIIWEVGYEDISSFRRLFKRETGCTMEQYRKRFSYVVPSPQSGRLVRPEVAAIH
ncbi:transcriptional regulator [Hahella sp. CCB-MM4]|uniref:GlxA family transcriptional regulator n=1 Tax=Hahella sp. (strain CCB-MM4) TaxID=1926491 RepID=UPI000B9C3700|nr:GlxA family transcriptional regulator [Hahella sp. CCB-MM4]OZG72263.1 transcriptional regulator [Hahella sp. CCB-MM4]